MPRWRRGPASTIARYSVFDVQSHQFVRDSGASRAIHTFVTPDWCNVVPFTADGRVILVRQHRFGTHAASLEIPGGVIDAGESPLEAATRELREETGYEARELIPLGVLDANPALQATKLHMFLARGCRPHPLGQQLEEMEDCEVLLVERDELDRMLDRGEIGHALVWSALHALQRYEARTSAR